MKSAEMGPYLAAHVEENGAMDSYRCGRLTRPEVSVRMHRCVSYCGENGAPKPEGNCC